MVLVPSEAVCGTNPESYQAIVLRILEEEMKVGDQGMIERKTGNINEIRCIEFELRIV